ncbi:hypothetical protein DL93DRAFT_2154652 [Clavulina sp. PMI_390]|nr:hypothetical protein DL93DRAFT_2154652 [Clavulina sp. PMI_390]
MTLRSISMPLLVSMMEIRSPLINRKYRTLGDPPRVIWAQRKEQVDMNLPPTFETASSHSGAFWLVVLQLAAQTTLATLILVFFLVYVDQRAFNVTERRPHYQLANGTTVRVPQRDWVPLQSDITTIISGAFNLLGKLYSGWIAVITWNYAFLLLERNGMKLNALSDMISLPFIPAMFPPPGYEPDPADAAHENRRGGRSLAFGILLIMLTAFPASFSPPIATGSISWHASTRNISNADIITDIGSQGANYHDGNPWGSWLVDPNFRPRYIQRASALSTHAWTSVTDAPDSPTTFKRVVPSVESLPVGASLNSITIPIFDIESFEWVTDSSDVTQAQLSYLSPSNSPGTLFPTAAGQNPTNPLLSSAGALALLPDVPYNTISATLSHDTSQQQPVMVQSKSTIAAVAVNYYGDCDASTIAIFGRLPSNILTTSVHDATGYSMCFVFAKITYSAGAAVCTGCEVVFPLVVQNPAGAKLSLQPDIATTQALYVMADVIGTLTTSNVTLPAVWDNIESYTKEILVRGYSSAWTVMSELFAFYSPLPSTYVDIPVNTSRADVDHRRLWGWYALQVLAFVGGLIFLMHIHMVERYPISNPLMHGLMLDVNMSVENKTVAEMHLDTWTEDFKETFITWERESSISVLAIKGPLKLVRGSK